MFLSTPPDLTNIVEEMEVRKTIEAYRAVLAESLDTKRSYRERDQNRWVAEYCGLTVEEAHQAIVMTERLLHFLDDALALDSFTAMLEPKTRWSQWEFYLGSFMSDAEAAVVRGRSLTIEFTYHTFLGPLGKYLYHNSKKLNLPVRKIEYYGPFEYWSLHIPEEVKEGKAIAHVFVEGGDGFVLAAGIKNPETGAGNVLRLLNEGLRTDTNGGKTGNRLAKDLHLFLEEDNVINFLSRCFATAISLAMYRLHETKSTRSHYLYNNGWLDEQVYHDNHDAGVMHLNDQLAEQP